MDFLRVKWNPYEKTWIDKEKKAGVEILSTRSHTETTAEHYRAQQVRGWKFVCVNDKKTVHLL